MASSSDQKRLAFAVDVERSVSGLLDAGPDPKAVLVFAHGAGAGMAHPFMADIATCLAASGTAVLRFNFPYMEAGKPRPDRPPLAVATVRAAVAEAYRLFPSLPLFAGGKSFGGRMTSTAQAEAAMPGVKGLIFFGFPLHPAGKPSSDRAAHLSEVGIPMLFLQGTRDALAEVTLIEGVCRGLKDSAVLRLIDDGDHSFHVRKSSGRDDEAVRAELVADATAFIDRVV